MTVLGIETSTSVCSAALMTDGRLLKQCINREGGNHARLLPVFVEQLLAEARAQGLTVEAVALSEGPGSYTGLRIGTSTAKGLCYGLNVPLIPVSTLQVLCEAARTRNAKGLLFPMIDARRMEVYTAPNGEGAHAVVVEKAESLLAICPQNGPADEVAYFGDGAEKCSRVLPSEWRFIPDIVPEAQYVCALAQSKPMVTDIAYYEPYYLKEFIAAQSHVKGLV